jgi:polyhydroxybutyrate depolymerase
MGNFYAPPLDSVLNGWAGFNNCLTLNDTVFNGNDYLFVKWQDCECSSEIHFYITRDGGHSWPGGKPGGWAGADTPSTAINANDLILDFFQDYSLNCQTRIVIQKQSSGVGLDMICSPNPFYGTCKISLREKHIENCSELLIYDIQGRLVKSVKDFKDTYINLDVGSLQPGILIVELKTVRKRYYKRLISLK